MQNGIRRKIGENVNLVRERIERACAASGRDPGDVTLIAITKYVGLDVIKLLPDLGLRELGESRAQELVQRAGVVNEFLSRRARDLSAGAMPRPRWHMVGHLQRNKVKMVLPWCEMIHSVDSLRLAEEIDAQAAKLGREMDILLQVNAGQESTKFGVAVAAAVHLAEVIAPMPHVRLCGLMTMAPLTDDEDVLRSCFDRCRELFEEVRDKARPGRQFRHLSMGMSNDYEVAIACGATLVRVGSALFEGIPQTRAGES